MSADWMGRRRPTPLGPVKFAQRVIYSHKIAFFHKHYLLLLQLVYTVLSEYEIKDEEMVWCVSDGALI